MFPGNHEAFKLVTLVPSRNKKTVSGSASILRFVGQGFQALKRVYEAVTCKKTLLNLASYGRSPVQSSLITGRLPRLNLDP